MSELTRALRRLTGHYVPYLEPYWDSADLAAVHAWLSGGVAPDGRWALLDALQPFFPNSAEIILTDSGKSALYVCLKRLNVAANAEVVLPSYCCASVIASIIRAGCVPVLADIDEHFNIAHESVVRAISPRTGAIVVPHLFGLQAASLEAITDLGRSSGIPVIEDVTQAFGLRLSEDRMAGTLGDAAIFSSGPGKPVMGPGGGWAVLNRPGARPVSLGEEAESDVRRRLERFLARFTGPYWRRGQAEVAHSVRSRLTARRRASTSFDSNRWASEECKNLRVSQIEAWLSARQIKKLETNLELRTANARRWAALLSAVNAPCTLPPAQHNTHTVLPLTCPDVVQAKTMRRILEAGGIATEPCYTPLHLRALGSGMRRTNMDRSDTLWQQVFAVPVRPNLLRSEWRRIEAVVANLGGA